MNLCMGAWLNGCMSNDSKKLSNSIHPAAFKVVTYSHTNIHSYSITAEIGKIDR